MKKSRFLTALTILFIAVLAACSAAAPTATPPGTFVAIPTEVNTPKGPPAGANPLAGVPGIVEPNNHGWPRLVEGMNGRVTIQAKPQRIINASLGHDEVTFALVPASRVAGVGAAVKLTDYSNVADLAKNSTIITSEPETIIAQKPDVVVTGPFLKAETVTALTRVGIPVVQTDQSVGPKARIDNILLMGYIYGEEERAVALAKEVQARVDYIDSIAKPKPASQRQKVLALTSYSSEIYTAGKNSTEGSIIEAAGGINVAAEQGLEYNPTISVESIVAMAPDIIIITQPSGEAEPFKESLLKNPALAKVPAIHSKRVYLVQTSYFTTLSFWNVRGVEEMAKILWPLELSGKQFGTFSRP